MGKELPAYCGGEIAVDRKVVPFEHVSDHARCDYPACLRGIHTASCGISRLGHSIPWSSRGKDDCGTAKRTSITKSRPSIQPSARGQWSSTPLCITSLTFMADLRCGLCDDESNPGSHHALKCTMDRAL